jgi:hypothetical protein
LVCLSMDRFFIQAWTFFFFYGRTVCSYSADELVGAKLTQLSYHLKWLSSPGRRIAC